MKITVVRFPIKTEKKFVKDLPQGTIYNQGVEENWYIRTNENSSVLLRTGDVYNIDSHSIYTEILDDNNNIYI